MQQMLCFAEIWTVKHQITEINADCLDSSMRFVDFICNEFKYEYTSGMFDIPRVRALCHTCDDFLHSLMCCIIFHTHLTHPPIRDNFLDSCIHFTSCLCNAPRIGSVVYRVLNFMQLQHECCKTVCVSLKHRETQHCLFGPKTGLDLAYSCITIQTKRNIMWLKLTYTVCPNMY